MYSVVHHKTYQHKTHIHIYIYMKKGRTEEKKQMNNILHQHAHQIFT